MTGIVSASAMVVVRDAVCTMVGTSRRVGVDAEGDAGVEGEVAVIAEAIIGGCRTLGGLGGEDVAGLSTSIGRRPRRGITASGRLPWTLPAVPALPLAG